MLSKLSVGHVQVIQIGVSRCAKLEILGLPSSEGFCFHVVKVNFPFSLDQS